MLSEEAGFSKLLGTPVGGQQRSCFLLHTLPTKRTCQSVPILKPKGSSISTNILNKRSGCLGKHLLEGHISHTYERTAAKRRGRLPELGQSPPADSRQCSHPGWLGPRSRSESPLHPPSVTGPPRGTLCMEIRGLLAGFGIHQFLLTILVLFFCFPYFKSTLK